MSVRETLELDISDALSAIEDVGSRLEDVAKAFGEVLSDALNTALGDLPIITPEVDAAPVTEGVADALDEAAAEPIDVEAEAGSVTAEIDAAVDAADTGVEVDAETGSVTDEIEAAVADADTTVEVELTVDTTQAEGAIDGLKESASGAGGPLDSLTDGLAGAGGAGAVLAGGLGGAATAMRGLGPVAAGVGAGVAGLAAGVGFLYSGALEAVSVTETWERSLGPLGDRILDLSSGVTGFDTDLASLAQTVGSSDEAVLIATQRFVQFQQAAGLADDQIVKNTQEMSALAAQIRVNNPALGEMDQIITTLTRGLQRGGRFVQAYGLSMKKTDIETRALEVTGKDLREELTEVDLVMGGLSLANEQLAPSFAKVQDGAQNAQVTFERLQEKIGDTIEVIGAPLVAPINDVMAELVAIFEAFGPIAGDIVSLLVDNLSPALETIADIARATTAVTERLSEALTDLGLAGDDAADGMNLVKVATDGYVRTALTAVPVIGPVLGALLDWARISDDVAEATSDLTDEVTGLRGPTSAATVDAEAQAAAMEDLLEQYAGAAEAVAQFAETATSKLPGSAASFIELSDSTNADTIRGNLQEQLALTERWVADMASVQAQGFDDILVLLGELGPERSALLMDQYGSDLRDLEDHLEAMAAAEQRARAQINTIALNEYLRLRGITGVEAAAINRELEAALQLGPVTQQEIEDARAVVTGQLGTIGGYQLGEAETNQYATALGLVNPTQEQLDTIAGIVANASVPGVAGQMGLDAALFYAAALGNSSPLSTQQINNLIGIIRTAPFGPTGTTSGAAAGAGIASGLGSQEGAASAEANAIGGSISTAIAGINWQSVGSNVVQGIINGISSKLGDLGRKAAEVAQALTGPIGVLLRLASPSRVMYEMGVNTVEGFVLGMEASLGDVSDVSASLASVAMPDGGRLTVGSSGVQVRDVSITVPITVSGGMDRDAGQRIGADAGRAAAAELLSMLRMEARVS